MKPYKALAVGVMVALQDLKVGDKIEASLRSLPNC